MSGFMNWREDILSALRDFEKVSELAGDHLVLGDVKVEFLPAPHKPPKRLPAGWAAVYGFWHSNDWLKVGYAGPKSSPRYTSQHYTGAAPSTLAHSLQKDAAWVKRETSRVNIRLPSTTTKSLGLLLEAFLHVRLRPKYERGT